MRRVLAGAKFLVPMFKYFDFEAQGVFPDKSPEDREATIIGIIRLPDDTPIQTVASHVKAKALPVEFNVQEKDIHVTESSAEAWEQWKKRPNAQKVGEYAYFEIWPKKAE